MTSFGRHRLLLPILGWIFITGLVGLAAEPAADRLYVGGTILTVNDSQPRAEAVAVAKGRIVAVGSRADVLARRGEQTEVVDLAGRTLVPGFIDGHSHFFSLVDVQTQALCASPPAGTCRSVADVIAALERIKERRKIGPGEFVMGFGCDPDLLAEKRFQQRVDVTFISGPKCLDVTPTSVRRLNETAAAPRKSLPTEPDGQQIGGESPMAAIAIREGVDEHESMVEPDGDFICLECLVFDPETGIFHECPELGPDLMESDADVAIAVADRSSPSPDASQHPLVQSNEKPLGKDIPSPCKGPSSSVGDILLLGLVELGSCGDMRKEQLPPFVRLETRFVWMLGIEERILHGSSQRRLPCSSSFSASRFASAVRSLAEMPCPSRTIECETAATWISASDMARCRTVASSDRRGMNM